MRLVCLSLIFLVFGLVSVLYGWYLSGLAAGSDFAPVKAIYSRTASGLFLMGVPMLLIGCFFLRKHMQND